MFAADSKDPSKLQSLTRAVAELWSMFDARMKLQAFGLLAIMLIIGVLEGLGIGLILPLFDLIGDPRNVATNRWLAPVHEMLGRPDHGDFIIMVFAGFFLLFLIKNILIYVSLFLQTRWVWRSGAMTMTKLVANYVRMPFSQYLTRNTGEFLRNVTTSVNQIFQGMVIPILNIIAETIIALSIIGVLVTAKPREAIIVAAVLAIPTLIFLHLSKPYLIKWGEVAHALHFRNLAALNHAFGAIKEIKVLGREENVIQAYQEIPFATAAVNEKTIMVNGLPRLLLETLTIGSLLIVAATILSQGRAASSILPTLGLFAAAAFRLMPSANRIVSLLNTINFSLAAVKDVQDDLHLAPARGSSHSLKASRSQDPDGFLLERIGFNYDGTELKALDDINLQITKGEAIALVGPSGAGKTTLANIILGLLTPTDGRIGLSGGNNGAEVKTFPYRISLVPQETFLIDHTLRSNIAFAVPDAEIDNDRVSKAVSMAHLDALIQTLPDGLDTVVGERGVRLSGGQKQRVAIARALYDDPDILVFDEATSALDAESEAAITEAINALSGDKTLIIIAHRLSTVRNCDRLYWMENGRIADSGTFAELTVRNAGFARMVRLLDLSGTAETEKIAGENS